MSEEAPVAAAEAVVEETPAVVEETPAVVEEAPAVVEEAPAVVEEVAVSVAETPVVTDDAEVHPEDAQESAEMTIAHNKMRQSSMRASSMYDSSKVVDADWSPESVFEISDINKNGLLDSEEMIKALAATGHVKSPEKAKKIMDKYQEDKSAAGINLEEFTKLCVDMKKKKDKRKSSVFRRKSEAVEAKEAAAAEAARIELAANAEAAAKAEAAKAVEAKAKAAEETRKSESVGAKIKRAASGGSFSEVAIDEPERKFTGVAFPSGELGDNQDCACVVS